MLSKGKAVRCAAAMLLVFSLCLALIGCHQTETDESGTDAPSSESQAENTPEAPSGEEDSGDETAPTDAAGTGNGTTAKQNGGKTSQTKNRTTRTVASNAITAPDKKFEVEIPDEIAEQIKPVRDHVIYETVKDMGKRTFKLGTFWPQEYIKGTFANSEFRAAQLRQIEKDYNCTIEIVAMSSDTYARDISARKAAGQIYAHVFDLQTQFNDLITNGTLANLRTVSSVDLKKNEWNMAMTLAATIKDGIYGVGVDQEKILRAYIYFNKNIAEKYNLGNLYDLVRKGEWTFDKFEELSKTVYEKSNHKIYGCASYLRYWLGNFAYANETSPVILVNNKAVFNKTDEKLLNVWNYWRNYAKAGLMDRKLFKELNPAGNEAKTESTMGAFTSGKALFFHCNEYAPPYLSPVMEDDYGLLPIPVGPDAKSKGYKSIITDARYYALYDEDPDIEDSGIILKAIANRCYHRIKDWDNAMAVSLRDEESLEMMHIVMNGELQIVAGGDVLKGGMYDYNVKAIPKIMLLEQTPKEAFDAISKSVQVQMDKYYSN